MKTVLIILTAILQFTALQVFSQHVGYKEITEKRIEYIARKLPLTSVEAEKFWPLFREFHAEREKLAKETKTRNKQFDKNPASEEEYLNAINFMIESKINQSNLMKLYNDKYLKVLSAEKVYLLYVYDEEFNKFLLNQLKGPGRERKK